MDIEKCLIAEHSKQTTTRIVNYIGSDKKKFDTLMQIFFQGETLLTQRAAWPLSYAAIAEPKLIAPYLHKLILKLKQSNNHPSIPRNILKILQEINIPKKCHGELVDICFGFILNNGEATAVRAFAITVATKICMHYPELKNELLLILNDLREFPQLPAINVRVRDSLKTLNKTK